MTDHQEASAEQPDIVVLEAERERLSHILNTPEVSVDQEGLAWVIGLVLEREDAAARLDRETRFGANGEPTEASPEVKAKRDRIFAQIHTVHMVLERVLAIERSPDRQYWSDYFEKIRAIDLEERSQALAIEIAEELGGQDLRQRAQAAADSHDIPRCTPTGVLEQAFPGIEDYLGYRRVVARMGEDYTRKTMPEICERALQWRAEFDAQRLENS